MIAIPRFPGLPPEDVEFAERALTQLDALEQQAAILTSLHRKLRRDREQLAGQLWAWKIRDRIEADLDQTAAGLRHLHSQIQQVELELHRLAWDSEKVRIPEPFDGTGPAWRNDRLS